jgi:hypothetical protein
MTFNRFVLTVWFITLAMLVSIINMDPSVDFSMPPHPSPAGFVVVWFFITSSFAIFVAGMFTMITSS